MRRALILAVPVLALVSLVVLDAAQEPAAKPWRPDFSGSWTLLNNGAAGEVAATIEGRGNHPAGQLHVGGVPERLAITQEGETLKIEEHRSGPLLTRWNKIEYGLDGRPSISQFVIEPLRGARPSLVISKWDGNKFVSLIDVVVPIESEPRHYSETLSISPEGILSVRIQRVGTPDSRTLFYRKTAAIDSPAPSITGVVIDGISGAPIGGARVEIRKVGVLGDDGPFKVSAADGRFTFQNVEAGLWIVNATADSYHNGFAGIVAPSDNPPAIEVGPSGPYGEVQVRLFKPRTVVGRVTDSQGNPVRSAVVGLIRTRAIGGRRSFVAGRSGTTDERGEYRIDGILTGNYVVAVSSGNTPGNAGPIIAPLYYPDSKTASSATQVTIGAADAPRFDFVLPPAGTLSISGQLEGEGGNSLRPITLTMIEPNGGLSPMPSAKVLTDTQGRFTFRAVTSGRYRIETTRYPDGAERPPLPMISLAEGRLQYVAPQHRPTEPVWYAQADVTLDTASVATPLRVDKAPRASGQLVFEEGARTDLATMNGGAMRLQSSHGAHTFPLWVNVDGSFESTGIPPGEYHFAVEGSAGRWPKAMKDQNGVDLGQRLLSVGTTGVQGLQVVFAAQPTRVLGAVEDPAGRSCVAVVVIFPVEPASWSDSGSGLRIRKSTTTDRGNFSVEGLLEGDYYLAAVKQGTALDLNTETLSRLSNGAATVRLVAGKPIMIGLVAR